MTDEPEPKRSHWPIIIVVVSIIVLAVTAVVGVHFSSTSGSAPASIQATSVDTMHVTIDISSYEYRPGNLSVPRGATVTWVNDDKVAHTATEKSSGSWDTQVIHEGESVSINFDKPGSYTYYCSIHPYMSGVLVVR